jgi:hypothetical protein
MVYTWKTAPSSMTYSHGNLTNHKAQEVVKWSDTVFDNKTGGYTPAYGNTYAMQDDTNVQLTQGNFYTINDTQSDVCEVSINAGSEHYACADVRLVPSSWINNFTGVGFEYYQDSDRNNSIFLRRVATIWYNAAANTYRGWGWSDNYEGNKETKGYFSLFHNFRNTDEITWQTYDWRFHGFIFEFRTTSGVGSSFTSKVRFFNLKLYTGAYTDSNTPRFLMPRFRSHTQALAKPTW